jgi:hypothetical protein
MAWKRCTHETRISDEFVLVVVLVEAGGADDAEVIAMWGTNFCQ